VERTERRAPGERAKRKTIIRKVKKVSKIKVMKVLRKIS
jgi:hypothetical protein